MTIATPPIPTIPGAAAITVAGEPVLLLPHRAAFWSAARTLLVADLHLDKCEVMRARGLPIPRALLDEQIARLDAAVRATQAQRVLVVGDLLHAPAGLTGPMVECFAAWRAAIPIDMAIVPGNHDRALSRVADAWRIAVLASPYVEGPFAFVHDPEHRQSRSRVFHWCGHVHPAVVLRRAGDSMKLPCFHLTARFGLLPAFSTFTAGGPVRRDRSDRVFGIADGQVIEV
jgi:DNA ligase-associated metallophosphoesterase